MALLRLTNFDDHPSEPGWLVFRFGFKDPADDFVAVLQQAGIAFERDEGEDGRHLVAVRQRHRETAVRLNYQVMGRYRAPFMSDAVLRWTVLGLVGLAIALALAGAILS